MEDEMNKTGRCAAVLLFFIFTAGAIGAQGFSVDVSPIALFPLGPLVGDPVAHIQLYETSYGVNSSFKYRIFRYADLEMDVEYLRLSLNSGTATQAASLVSVMAGGTIDLPLSPSWRLPLTGVVGVFRAEHADKKSELLMRWDCGLGIGKRVSEDFDIIGTIRYSRYCTSAFEGLFLHAARASLGFKLRI